MINYQGLPDHWNLALLFLSLVVAWWMSRAYPAMGRSARQCVRWGTDRPALNMIAMFSICMGINGVLSAIRYPVPRIHDEFSYLLAADTYAAGRLTNPTHPFWRHFETYHVLSQPSYISKYPPGNGLFLAFGQVLTGHPIVGSWLAVSLGIVATYWALLAWIDRRWALIGSWLLVINVPMLMAWGQTYWGGGVQMIGGSLALGAVRRIIDPEASPRGVLCNACWFACGAVILANSRPMEGFLVCLASAGLFVHWLWMSPKGARFNRLLQLGVPCLLIGSAGLASLAINNKAVTGKMTQIPYNVHSRQYSSAPLFLWSKIPPLPQYNLKEMEVFYRDWVLQRTLEGRTFSGYVDLTVSKLVFLRRYFTFVGGLCLLPLFYWVKRDRWLRLSVAIVFGLLLIELQLGTSQIFPHYVAPVACLFYAALFSGMKWFYIAGRRHFAFRLVVPTLAIYSLLSLAAYGFGSLSAENYESRVAVEQKLNASPGKHLVFVEYSPTHNVHAQWVYNRAAIDDAQIVWAHRLGRSDDVRLADYFGERTIWLWRADEGLTGLTTWHPAQSDDVQSDDVQSEPRPL